MSALMVLPQCPTEGHGQMELRAPGTPEQAFCGVWYSCNRCHGGVLFMSEGLQAQLAEQRRSLANAPKAKRAR
jgi:hypothetical protein